jgi:hypothetical protein
VQPAISFTPAPHVNTAPETFAPFNQYPLSTQSNHGHQWQFPFPFILLLFLRLPPVHARPAAHLLLPRLLITTALHACLSSRASVASSLCQTNTPPVQPEATMGSTTLNRTLAACRRPHPVAGGSSRRPPSASDVASRPEAAGPGRRHQDLHVTKLHICCCSSSSACRQNTTGHACLSRLSSVAFHPSLLPVNPGTPPGVCQGCSSGQAKNPRDLNDVEVQLC